MIFEQTSPIESGEENPKATVESLLNHYDSKRREALDLLNSTPVYSIRSRLLQAEKVAILSNISLDLSILNRESKTDGQKIAEEFFVWAEKYWLLDKLVEKGLIPSEGNTEFCDYPYMKGLMIQKLSKMINPE